MSCSSRIEMDLFELRIVLLGSVGAGKSFSGNKILGKENLFRLNSKDYYGTTECQKEQEVIDNQTVVVVDTPALLNNDESKEEIMTEIQNSIKLCEPGPHVFLFLVKLGKPFTIDQKEMKRIFGKNTLDYTMVLFNYEKKSESEAIPIGWWILKKNKNLKWLLEKCKYGYHVFDGRPEEVPELLKKINDQVKEADGRHYTAEMLEQDEKLSAVTVTVDEQQTRFTLAAQNVFYSGLIVGGLIGLLIFERRITSTIAATLGAIVGGLLGLALGWIWTLAIVKCKCCKKFYPF